MTAIDVRVYAGSDPDQLLGLLDRTRDRQWTDALSEPGSGSFMISALHPKLASIPGLLEYGNIVRMALEGQEVFAFVLEHKTVVRVDEGEDASRWIKVSGRGVLSLLEAAVVYPAGGLGGAAEREWLGSNAGSVMGDLFDEAVARGALAGVTRDFTDALDSGGNGFAVPLDISERAGSDLLRVAMRHAELAVDVQMTPDLELRYFNERGVNRAGPADSVLFRAGKQLEHEEIDGEGVIKNVLLLEGPEGFSDRQSAGSVGTYGRREGFIALGNAKTADQLTRAADRVLLTQAAPVQSVTASALYVEGTRPYLDFNVGDWVFVPSTALSGAAAQRVRAVTVSENDEGVVRITPELSSYRSELEIRIARWLKSIAGGTLGGTAAMATSPTPDTGTTTAISTAIAAAIDAHEAAFPHPDELADLVDVDVGGVGAGDVLTFDGVNWIPAVPGAPAALLPWEAVVAGGPVTWVNMPAAVTELEGVTHWRTLVDATAAAQVRLLVSVATAGAAGAVLRGQYSDDAGASWHDLAAGSEPDVSIATTGLKNSGWQALAAGATAEVLVRVVGQGGDAAADPVVVNVALQFR